MNAVQVCEAIPCLDEVQRMQDQWEGALSAYLASHDLFEKAGEGNPLETSWLFGRVRSKINKLCRLAEKTFGNRVSLKIDDDLIKKRFLPGTLTESSLRGLDPDNFAYSNAFITNTNCHPKLAVREGWTLLKVWLHLHDLYGGNAGVEKGLEDIANHLFDNLFSDRYWMRESSGLGSYERKHYKKEWIGKNLAGRMMAQFVERKGWHEVKSPASIDDFVKKWHSRSSYDYRVVNNIVALVDKLVLALADGGYGVPPEEVDQINEFVEGFKTEDLSDGDTAYETKTPFLFSFRLTQSSVIWKFEKEVGKHLMNFIAQHSSELHKHQKRIETEGDF